MAIYHDAYLFKINDLADYIRPIIEQLDTDNTGLERLYATVLELFESSEQLKFLADIYGSWDKAGVSYWIERNRKSGVRPEDIGFYLTFLIFHRLQQVKPTSLGLRHYHEILRELLTFLQWNKEEIHTLIYGKRFIEFAKKHIYISADHTPTSYWEYVQPASTASSMGWLDSHDIRQLKSRLIDSKDQVSAAISTIGMKNAQIVYELAVEMLTEAERRQQALCLIISS
jgi:hypothetical protein